MPGTEGSPVLRADPTPWAELRATPLILRLYLTVVAAAAITLPVVLQFRVQTPHASEWLTVAALFAVSVVNVEVSRWLTGGLSRTHQPHKALSAWAFASALLLPPIWLLVVVPITYTHARLRGIRVPMWKWIGSGLYLILCGVAAATVRHELLGGQGDWMQGDGQRGFFTMLAAGAAFLALETVLFAGSAYLNHAHDEVWLRAMLSDPAFYLTESGVLLTGGLLSAVWTAGIWFTVLLIPIYVLIQHAVLLAPLRERAAAAVELAHMNAELAEANAALGETNTDLNEANQFKTDLIGMLSHEIGNPLTVVRGYAQLGIELGDEPGAAQDALSKIERNADRMAAVLADIVQLVASERSALTARPQRLHLSTRLQEAVSGLPLSRRPQVDCAPELEVLVQPGHLDQILTNLISNAQKFAGGLEHVIARRDGSGYAEIAVIDHGPGIRDEFTEQLFQRYERDETTAAKVTGTGIGLFISRELARANGGDLVHTPVEPHGSRFVVRLPVPI